MTRPGAPLGKLMARAVRGLGSHPEPDDIETRLLDAAIEVLSERGTPSSWTSYRRVRASLTTLASGSQRDSLSASRL